MLLYITRHGQTEWNIQRKTQGMTNTNLTALGREQARLLAKRLLDKNIQRIYCSDLDRAYETAQIIGDLIGLIPITTPYLREVCFGNWEGYNTDEIEQKYPGQLDLWYQDKSFCPIGGESINAVHERIKLFITEYITPQILEETDNVLVVSHALTSKLLLLELMGMPIDYARRIKMHNVGLSALKLSSEINSLVFLNDSCHLTT